MQNFARKRMRTFHEKNNAKISRKNNAKILQKFRFFASFREMVRSLQTLLKIWFVFTLLVSRLFVCLYPINVKTAEPIGSKFFVRPCVTQGRFKDERIFKHLPLTNLIYENFENPRNFLFVFVLQYIQKEHVHNRNLRWARSALKA